MFFDLSCLRKFIVTTAVDLGLYGQWPTRFWCQHLELSFVSIQGSKQRCFSPRRVLSRKWLRSKNEPTISLTHICSRQSHTPQIVQVPIIILFLSSTMAAIALILFFCTRLTSEDRYSYEDLDHLHVLTSVLSVADRINVSVHPSYLYPSSVGLTRSSTS